MKTLAEFNIGDFKKLTLTILFITTLTGHARTEDKNWISLIDGRPLEAWQNPHGDWMNVGEVAKDPKNPKVLIIKPGNGILVNGTKGFTSDLLSKENFQDVNVHLEFLIPKGSNSGIKFEGLYEIQIFDSWGVKKLTGGDCGGIYPRAELRPFYHHIDNGVPPRLNAARPPGEWQSLDVSFQAPKFDPQGKKIANARFVKVVLNGKVIHEEVEVQYPTGHAWHNKELPNGPLLLQGDHGPVAFRNLRVRSYGIQDR